jgi:uncharacterized membrane protein
MRNKWFPLFVVAGMLLFSAAVYNQLPDYVPSHWNAAGEVDGYSPKLEAAILLPGLVAGLVVLRFAARRIDPRREAYSQFEGTYYLFINALALFFAMIHIMSLGAGLGWQFSINQLILPALGLLLAVLGNEMRRIQPNWFIGIRTPWTLSDSEVWRKTHAVAGRGMVVVGLITLVTGLLLPGAAAIGVMLALLVTGAAGLFYYSYRQYQIRRVG